MNYAYLSGFLQSKLEHLATDTKFLKMKSEENRLAYVREMIREAQLSSIEFENEVTTKMASL